MNFEYLLGNLVSTGLITGLFGGAAIFVVGAINKRLGLTTLGYLMVLSVVVFFYSTASSSNRILQLVNLFGMSLLSITYVLLGISYKYSKTKSAKDESTNETEATEETASADTAQQ